jgi:AhpD family alkylhydroperoxidase
LKIPNRFEKLKSKHSKFIEAVETLGKAVKAEGPIEEKTAQLIQLSAAAAIKSEGSVHSHTRRALAAGATTEEITHAVILVTSIIGFPAVAAALSWVDDILNEIS